MTKNKLSTIKDTQITDPDIPEGAKELTLAKRPLFSEKRKKTEPLNLSIRSRFLLKYRPEKSYMVTIFFGNGTRRTFVIKVLSDDRTFKYKGNRYHLDDAQAYFDLSLNQFHLCFYERNPSPIQREIFVHRDGKNAPYFSISPEGLEELVQMKYVDAIIRGASTAGAWLIWVLVAGAVVVIILLMNKGS